MIKFCDTPYFYKETILLALLIGTVLFTLFNLIPPTNCVSDVGFIECPVGYIDTFTYNVSRTDFAFEITYIFIPSAILSVLISFVHSKIKGRFPYKQKNFKDIS